MPVTLINPFVVEHASEAAFVADWQRTAAIFAGAPGYLDTQLYRSLDPAAKFRFVNIAHWTTPDSWRAAMQAYPPAEKGQPGIEASPALYEPAAGGAVPAAHSGVADEIKGLEKRLAQAYRTGDVDMLDRLLADDYVVTDGPGTTSTKAKVLADHRDHRLKVDDFGFDEISVLPVTVEVAVVTGRFHWTASYDLHPVNGSFRYLRAYARDGHGWRIRAGQVTPIVTR